MPQAFTKAFNPIQTLNPMPAPAQAAYHGVPLVTMPGHVIDQADNAVKAARLGFGIPIYVDGNFSAATLSAGLTRVLTEPQFRANAARVATKMRARRRTPAQESVGAHARTLANVRLIGLRDRV